MAVLALILGYKMSIVCLFISCFMALPVAIYNLQKKDKKLLPFGPYLAFGTIIIMLFNINFDMIIEFIKIIRVIYDSFCISSFIIRL